MKTVSTIVFRKQTAVPLENGPEDTEFSERHPWRVR